MSSVKESPLNSVKISESSVAFIAQSAAKSVDGVHSLKKSPVTFNSLFSKNITPSAITIKIKDGAADITAVIVVKYSFNARKVAEIVQSRVKNDIQNMAGLAVSRVNIVIDNIFFDDVVKDFNL